MKKAIAPIIAPALFSIYLLAGCSGDGATADAGVDAGPSPPRPIEWKALPTEGAPSPRFLHTAVWTGSKMIIWGGSVDAVPPATDTGAIYDPASRTWSPTSTQGAAASRYFHTAVWTGSKMIIWGGFGVSGLAGAGALYDPATDTWTPMATAGQPEPRQSYSAVWTGNTMIIWGGMANGTPLNSGGIYDPQKDAWTAIAEKDAPAVRFNHAAVFTGSKMIVWGGYDFFDWLQDGATFDPAAAAGGAWTGVTSLTGTPSRREMHTGVWTSSEMLIWGGWTGGPYEGTGASFDPGTDAWTAMPMADAPSPRAEHVGLWAGDELVIWGGCGDDACKTVLGDGGRFTPGPGGGSWTRVDAQPGLSPTRGAAGVTSGSEIYIWGGRDTAKNRVGTGAESVL